MREGSGGEWGAESGEQGAAIWAHGGNTRHNEGCIAASEPECSIQKQGDTADVPVLSLEACNVCAGPM